MMIEPYGPSGMAEYYAGFIDIVLLKGTALVVVAAIACRGLRRSSASIRHGVWAAAFFVLLALPAARLTAPQTDITVVGIHAPSRPGAIPVIGAPNGPASVVRPAAVEPDGLPVVSPAASERAPIATVGIARIYRWVVAIWFVGLLLHLIRFAGDLRAIRRLRARAEPGPGRVRRRARRISAELGLQRVPATIVSPDLTVPSTFGLLRPAVILPTGIDAWPDERLDAALVHELNHLRRRDYLTHLVAAVVKAAYWVNPAVWYAARRLETERERACDDGVVADRVDAIRYAEQLVDLAWCGRETAAQPVLPFANRSSLAERVSSLLDGAQARTPLRQPARLLIVLVAAFAVVSAAAVEIFGITQSPAQHAAALSDPDPIVRRHAAWALGEAESLRYVDVLIEHLADPDARVRVVSAWALGEIKDPRADEPLTTLLTDEDARVREMAVLSIGEIEDPSGLGALREAGSEVVSDDARTWAIAQILHRPAAEVFKGDLVHPDARAADMPRYLDELGNPDPRVRTLAAERLGILGATEAVDPLLDLLEDPDPAVRAMAVWALDEINPSSTAGGTAR